jgi:hypothetical protein
MLDLSGYLTSSYSLLHFEHIDDMGPIVATLHVDASGYYRLCVFESLPCTRTTIAPARGRGRPTCRTRGPYVGGRCGGPYVGGPHVDYVGPMWPAYTWPYVAGLHVAHVGPIGSPIDPLWTPICLPPMDPLWTPYGPPMDPLWPPNGPLWPPNGPYEPGRTSWIPYSSPYSSPP